MAEESSTDAIRSLASKWTLLGDERLLDLLQTTHQNVIRKCQDVNSKLEEMSLALDDANIHLHNVNNKFMALSNSQFIESRVYDDDTELTTDLQTNKDEPTPPSIDELSMLKSSLAILDRAHETAEIMDDSDSDCSDAEISVVLKPKDLYSHRPLPHIIGTQAWRNKWHAGLLVEDSDSDSTTSRRERDGDIEQYSSESEEDRPLHNVTDDRTLSESSSLRSDHTERPHSATTKPSPAAVAAELARRLATPHTIVQQEPEVYVPPTVKVYKPEKPPTGTIFSDEPPPLDNYIESTESEDEDIFAEINKNKSFNKRNPVQTKLANDLFGFDQPPDEQADIFGHIVDDAPPMPVKQKSTIFDEILESEPNVNPPKEEPVQDVNSNDKHEEGASKKPVGGISLFGSNKGTESIGAAILKRNRRKSSSSDDETENESLPNRIAEEKPKIVPKNIEQPKNKVVDEVDKSLPKKEKDIFEDLFAKPPTEKKRPPTQNIAKKEDREKDSIKEKEKKNFKDLFSDNIFDDIDDIFTSNVAKESKLDSKQKSIFDDDDDLFSEIAAPKTQPANSKTDKKNIFDEDDELFSDVKPKTESPKEKTQTNLINDPKTDVKQTNIENSPNIIEDTPKFDKTLTKSESSKADFVKSTEMTKERNLFDDSPQNISKFKPQKTKSIFDSDSDDDIFANIKISDSNNLTETSKDSKANINFLKGDPKPNISNLKSEEKSKVVQSPLLFDDDDDDELFASTNKSKKEADKLREKEQINDKNVPSFNDKDVIKQGNNDNNEFIANDNVENVVDNSVEVLSRNEKVIKETPLKNEKLHKIHVLIDNKPKKEDSFDDNSFEDDLFSTPKHEKIETSIKNVPEVIQYNHGIDSEVEEKTEPQSEVVGANIEHKNKIPDVKADLPVTQDLPKESKTVEGAANVANENETLMTAIQIPLSNDPDIFDDIFSEPPKFEKTAEPKKSKNVNALFDDDSDDEALFFKKDDVITDEKPEIFSTNANFDIFVDEPPDIDVDFTPKTSKNVHLENNEEVFSPTSKAFEDILEKIPETKSKDQSNTTKGEFSPKADKITLSTGLNIAPNNSNISVPDILKTEETDTKTDSTKITIKKAENTPNDLFEDDLEKDLFGTPDIMPKTNTNIQSESMENKVDSDDELFSNLPKSSQNTGNPEKKSKIPDQKSQSKEVKTSDDVDDISKESQKDEIKIIGKLNTKNFNINVNALMPGASPKKIKELKQGTLEAETEPKTDKFLQTDETDKAKSNKNEAKSDIDSKPPKSITFESKPESDVLDNNLSKQRVRIQVKRRPSTRKARHEAARKSGIDFGDETDNSTSCDSPVKVKKDIHNTPIDFDTSSEAAKVIKEDFSKTEIKNDNTSNSNNTDESLSDNVDRNINKVDRKKTTTTKIVYILNDEDIFNTNTNKNTENKDIFDTKSPEDIFKTQPVQTIGNVYKKDLNMSKKQVTKEEPPRSKTKSKIESSLFDDSDEELFKTNKKVEKKANIFDSDSEEDLFSGKKKKDKQNEEKKNKEVKQKKVNESLFSDDDGDDLFGAKKEKAETKRAISFDDDGSGVLMPSTSKETTSKSAKPVFEDPLSMLGED